MASPLTDEQRAYVHGLLAKARVAMQAIADYDQAKIDRLCQAMAWATANEAHMTRIANLAVDETELGDRVGRVSKRFKIIGVLRDALRQKSMGIIEEIPEKGIVKYAKPAGVIASLIPTTNPEQTPPVTGIYALKCKDAVIFSPHPRAKKTTSEVVRVMREAMRRQGAPEDLFQVIEKPSIPQTQELMSICDLTMATGGQPMVRAAYSSGKPAYGVGAGNSTMVIDETANIEEAARNTRTSKTSDFGSGCSADGNLVVEASIYDAFLAQLQAEGGYLASDDEKAKLEAAMWDSEGHRTIETVARAPQVIAKAAIYKYQGFDQALEMVRGIYDVGGKGHSVGIYSFDDDHINRLALMAPVSRIMVRQAQSKANAGAFNNGMPMTSSLGCGIWGGNITNENVSLKHYMNVTWVSRPIAEDRPSDAELFGEFYQSEIIA
jgi:sulfoacetaldehyde dehydrogenase